MKTLFQRLTKTNDFTARASDYAVSKHERPQTDEENYPFELPDDDELDWEIPEVPAEVLIPPPELEREFLPAQIGEYVFHNALKLDNAPPEFVAVAVIAAAASIIGGSAVIVPKEKDNDWKIVPTIWASLVGSASTMKTPCMQAGLSLIPKQEKTSEGSGSIVINDATTAALTVKLSQEPHGVLISHDELTGWLTDLESKANRSERSFYLSAFNGSVSHNQLRISRENVELEASIISLVGGIQPSMLIPFMKSRLDGKVDDGLFERLQLTVFPRHNKKPTDIAPDQKVFADARKAFIRLKEFRESNNRTIFRFSEKAQLQFNKFHKFNINRLRSVEGHEEAMFGKYSALCAKLALIFHLISVEDIKNVDTSVESIHVEMALNWIRFLEGHYRRVVALAKGTAEHETLQLMIDRFHELPNVFSKRELVRKKWRGLSANKNVDKVLKKLETQGFLRQFTSTINGRKVGRFIKHPDYRK